MVDLLFKLVLFFVEARVKFESKRKAHYNEYYAVKLARKLMEVCYYFNMLTLNVE